MEKLGTVYCFTHEEIVSFFAEKLKCESGRLNIHYYDDSIVDKSGRIVETKLSAEVMVIEPNEEKENDETLSGC